MRTNGLTPECVHPARRPRDCARQTARQDLGLSRVLPTTELRVLLSACPLAWRSLVSGIWEGKAECRPCVRVGAAAERVPVPVCRCRVAAPSSTLVPAPTPLGAGQVLLPLRSEVRPTRLCPLHGLARRGWSFTCSSSGGFPHCRCSPPVPVLFSEPPLLAADPLLSDFLGGLPAPRRPFPSGCAVFRFPRGALSLGSPVQRPPLLSRVDSRSSWPCGRWPVRPCLARFCFGGCIHVGGFPHGPGAPRLPTP